MNPEEHKQFSDMQQAIQELLDWKRARREQQITLPLDEGSKNILLKDVVIFKDEQAGTFTPTHIMTIEINGKNKKILSQ